MATSMRSKSKLFNITIELGKVPGNKVNLVIGSRVEVSFDKSVNLWVAEDTILHVCAQGKTEQEAISELINAGNHVLSDEDAKQEVIKQLNKV